MEATQKKTKNRKASSNTGLTLNPIQGKTNNQKMFFKNFDKYQVLSLTGSAGTGKSYIAVHQALQAIDRKEYTHLMIIRSAVASRNIGFLPGNKKEKMDVYESPYITIVNKLFDCGTAYSTLKQKKIITFEPSSFLRGETFDDCVIIVDECQNMAYNELYTILTRIGDNCKVILCGDMMQDDLTSERYNEVSGYDRILKALSKTSLCYQINFTVDDIVRSGFVKEFIKVTQM